MTVHRWYSFEWVQRGRELSIEEAVTQTLAELGRGFAFYGRQYHLDVEVEDFYVDLLLVHPQQVRG